MMFYLYHQIRIFGFQIPLSATDKKAWE